MKEDLPHHDLNRGPMEPRASMLPMSYADPYYWHLTKTVRKFCVRKLNLTKDFMPNNFFISVEKYYWSVLFVYEVLFSD